MQHAQQHFLMRTFVACSNIPHWQHLDAAAAAAWRALYLPDTFVGASAATSCVAWLRVLPSPSLPVLLLPLPFSLHFPCDFSTVCKKIQSAFVVVSGWLRSAHRQIKDTRYNCELRLCLRLELQLPVCRLILPHAPQPPPATP